MGGRHRSSPPSARVAGVGLVADERRRQPGRGRRVAAVEVGQLVAEDGLGLARRQRPQERQAQVEDAPVELGAAGSGVAARSRRSCRRCRPRWWSAARRRAAPPAPRTRAQSPGASASASGSASSGSGSRRPPEERRARWRRPPAPARSAGDEDELRVVAVEEERGAPVAQPDRQRPLQRRLHRRHRHQGAPADHEAPVLGAPAAEGDQPEQADGGEGAEPEQRRQEGQAARQVNCQSSP